jgi:hypothetical protein
MPVEITSFKPFEKSSLRGFLTIRMSNIGLEIRDATVHQKDGKRWIGLPAKSFQKDGEIRWSPICDFYDKARAEQFQRACLQALDEFLSKGGGGRKNGF